MKFEKIQPGMVLYDVHSYRMGNTTMRSVGVWSVNVISVDAEKRNAVVSWNGNTPEQKGFMWLEKLRATEPLLIKSGWGYRLATREESKAAKEPA